MHKSKTIKTKVGIRRFRSDMGTFLRRAHDGEVIVLTSHDRQVAEIHPPAPWATAARRKPGTLKGRIKIAPDFDTLPEDLIDVFEA